MAPHENQTIARLTIPAEAGYLSICRLAAGAVGDGVGLSDGQLSDLRLAVSEVCATAVGDGRRLELTLRLTPIEVEVSVCGRGGAGDDLASGLCAGPVSGMLQRLCTRSAVTAPNDGAGTTVTFAVPRPVG
jgi:anti-sigma regulatory factor (Ser/Thr protein kinase)